MLRIAVCDDDKAAVQAHTEITESCLKQCESAGKIDTYTSSEALLYDITKDGFYFDLILLDIAMPEMNGIETFERMKEIAAELPVIFLTASGYEDDVMNAIRLGAANYLKKPFFPKELLKRVAKELEKE